jgi:signal transduction histidine kinase
MFKSLQARLVLSYMVIIIVCLALVGLAALVMLRGYQRNLVYSRLSDRSVVAAAFTAQALRRGASPQETADRLAQQLTRGDGVPVSVYLVDLEGRVVASRGEPVERLALERLASQVRGPRVAPARGELQLDAGERLLYVAEPVRASEDGQPGISHLLIMAESYRPMRLALGDLLPRLLWSGAIAFVVSLGLAALLAYSISRPLERIAQAAEDVAGGSYDQRLQISTPREIARLAKSFNRMARQVQATLQSQQDLVANVSHELKTPLTSIQGYSQALLDGTASDATAQERAAVIIHEEAGRMRRLVDELLQLTRLESGEVPLAREPVDMADLLRDCAARFTAAAKKAGSSLELHTCSTLPVMGDSDRLSQVLDNLVDNALKHSDDVPESGRVILEGERREEWVSCSVTDNGPGIPTRELTRIFERFYQVEKSRVRRGSGAGLGLAIAREIVEGHGGQIVAESVEGLGTRFTIELPLQRA